MTHLHEKRRFDTTTRNDTIHYGMRYTIPGWYPVDARSSPGGSSSPKCTSCDTIYHMPWYIPQRVRGNDGLDYLGFRFALTCHALPGILIPPQTITTHRAWGSNGWAPRTKASLNNHRNITRFCDVTAGMRNIHSRSGRTYELGLLDDARRDAEHSTTPKGEGIGNINQGPGCKNALGLLDDAERDEEHLGVLGEHQPPRHVRQQARGRVHLHPGVRIGGRPGQQLSLHQENQALRLHVNDLAHS